MFTVLGITFPIFAMIAIGYVLVARGVFAQGEMKTFGTYLMNLALPALVFHAVSSRPVGEVFNLAYMSIYGAGALITMALGFLWFSATQTPSRRGVAVLGTASPNSGFIGYPLMLVLFPDQASLILALNMLVENIVVIPLALVIMELGKPRGEGHVLRQLARVLVGVVKRPLVIGLILGLVVSVSGLGFPAPAERLVTLLSASAAAPALIVIGGSLVGLPMRGNRGLAGQIVVGKLIVMPAATVLVLMALRSLGVTLPPDLATAVILSSSLPMIAIYSVLAQEAGHEGLASLAQLGATTLAFVTVNLLLLILT